MKISNTLKKVVVISIFCSQAITLYPMQEVQTRPTGLSESSDLTFPGSVNQDEPALPRDPKTESAARRERLKTLFYDEGDTVINIPGKYQDEQDPANLDEVRKKAISQDADKDSKALAQQQKRKASLAARLSEVDAEIDELGAKDLAAQSTPGLQAKMEQASQLKEESKSYIERFKESKLLKPASYLFIVATLAFAAWSTIDIARKNQTIPGAAYITEAALDAAIVVLAFVVRAFQTTLEKLKTEEGMHEIVSEPIQKLSLTQRVRACCSTSFEFVKNKAVWIGGSVALTSAILTIITTLQDNPESKTFVAAQLINNIETAIEFIFAGCVATSVFAISKIHAIRAKREAQRRASADGVVHKKTELQTLPDRRDSLNPEVHVMVVNPLVSAAPETQRDGHESDESPTETDKNSTPEKRDSSEKTSQASSVQVSPAIHPVAQQLDFTAEAELAV